MLLVYLKAHSLSCYYRITVPKSTKRGIATYLFASPSAQQRHIARVGSVSVKSSSSFTRHYTIGWIRGSIIHACIVNAVYGPFHVSC